MLDTMVSHHVMIQGLVNVADPHLKCGFLDLKIILTNYLIFVGYWALLVHDINSDFKQTNHSLYIQMNIDPLSFVT